MTDIYFFIFVIYLNVYVYDNLLYSCYLTVVALILFVLCNFFRRLF